MITRPRKVLRVLVAAGIAAVLATAGTVSVPTGPAAASTTPTEITVVPPGLPDTPTRDQIWFAGETGFLHVEQGFDGVLWTNYATGATHGVPVLEGVRQQDVHPAGGDEFAVFDPDTPGGTIGLGHADDTALSSYQVPDGYYVTAVGDAGRHAVVIRPSVAESPPSMELLDIPNGTVSPLVGLPEGSVPDANPTTYVPVDGASHALLGYDVDTYPWQRYALVDLATGVAVSITAMQGVNHATEFTRTGVAWRQGDAIRMLTQEQILAGADSAPKSVTLPAGNLYWTWAALGGHLVAAAPLAGAAERGDAVYDLPFDGRGPRRVLTAAMSGTTPDAGGGVLVAGGADGGHTAIHRFTLGADGELVDEVVRSLSPVVPENAGIAMARGELRHFEYVPRLGTTKTDLYQYNHGIAPAPDPTGAPYGAVAGGTLPAGTIACEPGRRCVHAMDGYLGGPVVPVTGAAGTTAFHAQVNGASSWPDTVLPFPDGRLMDVSERLLAVADDAADTLYVVDGGGKTVWSGALGGTALWHDTFWEATGPGTITARTVSYRGTSVTRTISTGSDCTADEVQVAQHWLYWSCGGTAGVYDLTTDAAFSVPTGKALLGDGYLVFRDADSLDFVDVHQDSAAPKQRLASMPASTLADDRGVDWAVDRFSGTVGYVAADDSVHVLSTGVPGSPLVGTGAGEYSYQPGSEGQPSWGHEVDLDRPVDSWRVTVVRAATGQTVFTQTGGPTRRRVQPDWDWKLPDGSPAPDGTYYSHVSATIDGTTVSDVPGTSETLHLRCTTPLYRDYECDGIGGSVLAIDKTDPSFTASWWSGHGDGKLHKNLSEAYWPLGKGGYSMIIPFGDLDGDGLNDLLVRNNSGDVGGYLGDVDEGNYFARGVSKHVTIGSGYGGFTAIVSTGDLNDDGVDDLVVRNSAGVLYFKAGTGKSQFKPGVRFTAGWNKYVKLIGVGDVDGDGCGDLMAVDGDGVMWFYRGTKDGRFATKVRVGAGWAKYNAVIGIGDLTGDAVPDLIARDSAGTIWRYDGTGHATWSTKTQITTGWSNYAMF